VGGGRARTNRASTMAGPLNPVRHSRKREKLD